LHFNLVKMLKYLFLFRHNKGKWKGCNIQVYWSHKRYDY
jgi:hypothetical protein